MFFVFFVVNWSLDPFENCMQAMKKLLITGVSGFLGWNLFHFLAGRYSLLGTYGRHRVESGAGETAALDIRDGAAVERVCRAFSPGVVIHAAAITSPAKCMRDREEAWAANVGGTENVARAARDLAARIIFISTDRVFDGRKGDYAETDAPGPLGQYGKTKLAGEEIVRETVPGHLILRLPLMYGAPSPCSESFIGFMLAGFREHTRIDLFTDQYRTPLYVEDAGRGMELILEDDKLTGLYHLGGPERINRSDFGYRMADRFGFDRSLINPVRMAERPHSPPTPLDASLNSEKFFRTTGFRGRGVDAGLSALRKILLNHEGHEEHEVKK